MKLFLAATCLTALAGSAHAQTTRTNLLDLKTDKATLVGKTVEVEGMLGFFAELGVLSEYVGDMSAIFIDVSRVERDQRRKLIACRTVCKGIVHGKVGPVAGEIGVVADRLILD